MSRLKGLINLAFILMVISWIPSAFAEAEPDIQETAEDTASPANTESTSTSIDTDTDTDTDTEKNNEPDGEEKIQTVAAKPSLKTNPVIEETSIVASIPLSDPSSATSALDLIQLESLANNAAYTQGFELALKMLPIWEGDSNFDFYYGIHALETGHFNEATFAFERLTLLYPNSLRYRLELARALFFNNNLDSAKSEFEYALSSNPPEKVKNNIRNFLKQISDSKKRASHSFFAGLNIDTGFDSNINSGTEEEGLEFPSIGFVTLQDEAQSQSSAFTQFSTRALYSFSHLKHHSLDVSLNTNHKRNAEVSTYDLDVINVFGGYSWQPTRSIRVQGGVNSSTVKLDGEAYQDQGSVTGMFMYTTTGGYAFSANLNAGTRTSDADNTPDADISLVSLAMNWSSSNLKFKNMALYTGSEDVSEVDFEHFGKTYAGLNYNERLLITNNLIRNMTISVQSATYQADMPVFNETRTDTAILGSWGYDWNAFKYMTLKAGIHLSHTSSNIELYTNYRAIFTTGIGIHF